MEIQGDERNSSGAIGLTTAPEELPMVVTGWTGASANSVLRLNFGSKDCEKLFKLESKSAQTQLTKAEQSELDGYECISVFLEFLRRGAQSHLAENVEADKTG